MKMQNTNYYNNITDFSFEVYNYGTYDMSKFNLLKWKWQQKINLCNV